MTHQAESLIAEYLAVAPEGSRAVYRHHVYEIIEAGGEGVPPNMWTLRAPEMRTHIKVLKGAQK